MPVLLEGSPTPVAAGCFDAAAFDAAFVAERERAAAGGYQASCAALEQLLLSCPTEEAQRRIAQELHDVQLLLYCNATLLNEATFRKLAPVTHNPPPPARA